MFQDHYKVLGVDYDATDESIRTSYLRLALVGESTFRHALFVQEGLQVVCTEYMPCTLSDFKL